MKKLITCLALVGCAVLAEEITVTTNAVSVVPVFGTAEHCSLINTTDEKVYLMPNATAMVISNAIPLIRGFPYTVEAPLIYNILLATTNGTSPVVVAFE
jgi:hypothetical protein